MIKAQGFLETHPIISRSGLQGSLPPKVLLCCIISPTTYTAAETGEVTRSPKARTAFLFLITACACSSCFSESPRPLHSFPSSLPISPNLAELPVALISMVRFWKNNRYALVTGTLAAFTAARCVSVSVLRFAAASRYGCLCSGVNPLYCMPMVCKQEP